ncbi:MAG: SpoIIE family protein phosphatase [Actinobacteria bacterium]|nr:SpoIIE family protein phosphatase [Actinomycetota bacterium]
MIATNRVTWSDEMYRIYGQPRSLDLRLETAMDLIYEEDREPIRGNLQAALAAGADADVPLVQYRVRRPDGEERVLEGRGRMIFADGLPERIVGIVHDITEAKRAEREHRVAETLQRSLLPDGLPEIPGISLAARYVPATADLEVGGDWYDVVQLPNGYVGAAIGDVAGHGLLAASIMGQLRMALRAYALSEESPAEVVRRTHRLLHRVAPMEMATLTYLVLNPDTGEARFSSAGHPPPLLVDADGARFIRGGLAPPLGAILQPDAYVEATAVLAPGSALVLYTDGLIERRGVSLSVGLDLLQAEAAGIGTEPEALGDGLLEAMVGGEVDDDVALLIVGTVEIGAEPVRLTFPAEPSVLAPLRHFLRRWLREAGASVEEVHDILLAVGEACSNAIQHAYGARPGTLEVELTITDGNATIEVTDRGRWREAIRDEGGHGIPLMSRLMDSVDVDHAEDGTVVRLRRTLRAGASV